MVFGMRLAPAVHIELLGKSTEGIKITFGLRRAAERRAADIILPGQATVWHAQSDGCGDCVARPKRLAMGVGSVANDSSDSPRPSYLRACHPVHR